MVEHYWQPQSTQGGLLPGLSSVAGVGRITPHASRELRELHAAVAAAHSRYLILVEASNAAPLERADFVLSEVRAALSYAFEGEENVTAPGAARSLA